MKIKTKKKNNKQKVQENRLMISEYEVTSEPLEDQNIKKLPINLQEKVKNYIEELYELTYRNPKEAIARLESLREQYPTIPQFSNYLYIAYSNLGDIVRSEALIKESYMRHQDYLFSKINYAELCFRKDNIAQILKIFNDTFDLKMLY